VSAALIHNARRVHFIGIHDIGTAAVACLAKQIGLEVTGSDDRKNFPYDRMVAEAGISVFSAFRPGNLRKVNPDLVVIANGLELSNSEIAFAIDRHIPFTSFPKFLGQKFLRVKTPIVVVGTHGKSTTSGWIARALETLGEEPNYFLGAVYSDQFTSYRRGKGNLFVVEGDEYHSAPFDLASKFLHYQSAYVVLNNLEFDHCDLYPDIETIEAQFAKLLRSIKQPERIIANPKDRGVTCLVRKLGLEHFVTWSRADGASPLPGHHNAENFAQAQTLLYALRRDQLLVTRPSLADIDQSMCHFAGMKQRLEFKGERLGVSIFHDFAHHPTAVARTIETLRAHFPSRRLLVAFNPGTFICRDPRMIAALADSLNLADKVVLKRYLPQASCVGTSKLWWPLRGKAVAFDDTRLIRAYLESTTRPGDLLLIMSNDAFDGLPDSLLLAPPISSWITVIRKALSAIQPQSRIP
jgi:UDP-N-acetylmuramate: L-alanyl-gamma-D-glutamyl-meso-diaminopimelate ligase